MLKRVLLWPSTDDWPLWWLLFINLQVSWFGGGLARDPLPLVGAMIVSGIIFFVLWPPALALSRWLRLRSDGESGDGQGGGHPERPLGER